MDYSTIQARVAEYLDRTDLTTHIQNWINDCRKDIALKYDFDYLYVEASISTSAGSATYSLPQDYLGHLTIFAGSKKLTRVGPREFDELYGNNDDDESNVVWLTSETSQRDSATPSGAPDYYIDRGMYIQLWPIPDNTYTVLMKYYAQPADFTIGTDEDYVSRFHFEAIIYGAALRGAVFLDDDVKIQIFTQSYTTTVQEIIKREKEKYAKDMTVRMKSWKDYGLTTFKRLHKIKNS